jgi:hypothetical protein
VCPSSGSSALTAARWFDFTNSRLILAGPLGPAKVSAAPFCSNANEAPAERAVYSILWPAWPLFFSKYKGMLPYRDPSGTGFGAADNSNGVSANKDVVIDRMAGFMAGSDRYYHNCPGFVTYFTLFICSALLGVRLAGVIDRRKLAAEAIYAGWPRWPLFYLVTTSVRGDLASCALRSGCRGARP